MHNAFAATSKTIGELLGNNSRDKIVVPPFQRGYSWEKKHVEAFWKDASSFQKNRESLNSPKMYFLGPIVVMSKDESGIKLLDGQQRLATATIFFSVLRDIARKLGFQGATDFARDVQVQTVKKDDHSFSLELGELDKLYFQDTVQSDPPILKGATLRSHVNIDNAKKYISNAVELEISSMDPTQKLGYLRSFWTMMRSDMVMACIPVESERDAFHIFETLNDRGLRLSVPDLLLNYLMGAATSNDARRKVRQYWNEMLEDMGRRDINRFLRHMWISKYGDLKKQDLFSALKELIETKNISSLDFARDCGQECDKYLELLNAGPALEAAELPVRSLVSDLDLSSSLPLLLSCHLYLANEDLAKVARWMLVFATRYSILSNLDPAGLENIFFSLARKVRTDLSDVEVSKQVGNRPSNRVNDCVAYIKETLRNSSPTDDQVKSAASDLILSPETAGYILGRLAASMQTATKEVKLDESNLEHIFPRSPLTKWTKREIEELTPFTWHIGNLTMLGKRINGAVKNAHFSVKKQHYELKSELKMAQDVAKHFITWDAPAIRRRAKELAATAVKVWNFDNPSRV